MRRFVASLGLTTALIAATAGSSQAADGTWERAWGGGGSGGVVCTVAASCLPGVMGGLGGQISNPIGVATDSAGNVYVADRNNNRIQKFNSSGVWERAWGKNVNGGGVFGICTVAASCLAGTAGTLGGEMNQPRGIATDSLGNVYVTDLPNRRIQKFDSSGNFLRAWGKNVNGGDPGCDPELVDCGVFEICTAAVSCRRGAIGSKGGEMPSPNGVATDSIDNVYVTDFNRVQKFTSSGAWISAWGWKVDFVNNPTVFGVCVVAAECGMGGTGGPQSGGEMNLPLGIATNSTGVYVADQSNNRIQKFAANGNWISAWGKNVNNTAPGVFAVCTSAPNCQQGTTGGLGGEMLGPYGVATDSVGNVYVADQSNNRIQKFNSSGVWERAWGRNVNGGGVFGICTAAPSCLTGSSGFFRGGDMIVPQGLGTDSAGNVYVADAGNHRIQKFADPAAPPPPPPPPPPPGPGTSPSGPTGERAAALKKCKKVKKKKARTACKRKANKRPV